MTNADTTPEPTPATSARTLSTNALAAALNVKPRQVRHWLAAGCPSARVPSPHGGRPEHRFDPLEVKAWLIGQGIAPRDTPAQPPAGRPEPTKLAAQQGYEGSVERLRQAEAIAFASWANAVKQKSPPANISAYRKMWCELTSELRRAEKDLAAVRQRSEAWVKRDVVLAAFVRLADEVRQALMSLPRALAPQAEGLTAAEIERIADAEVRACLRSLSAPPDVLKGDES